MDSAETKLFWGCCCSREQPLPREIMKSKTATGRPRVVTEPDGCRYIRWEAFLEAQHPPSRKGEKPSGSCSAKCCGHSGEFCTCPGNVSLPTSPRTSQLSGVSLWTCGQGKKRASSRTGTPALPLDGETLLTALRNQNKPFLFLHTLLESHSVVMVFLEAPLLWLKILHLQITTFGDACKELGRAGDNVELKLPETKCWQADCWAGH